MRDLISRTRVRAPARRGLSHYDAPLSPVFMLRREMDRLFDEAMRGFGVSPFGGDFGSVWPHVEVSERETDVCVTAELPGLEEKDIELRVEDNVLILRGEKRHERDDQERHYSERSYGRFERSLVLPADVDEDRAEAKFRNGVLTVTLPKRERPRQDQKRIAITH